MCEQELVSGRRGGPALERSGDSWATGRRDNPDDCHDHYSLDHGEAPSLRLDHTDRLREKRTLLLCLT
jgi:hypothetical protein